jgi:ABC-type phosphate transport system substrate-binding protein
MFKCYLAILMLLIGSATARADVVVVVNAANPIRTMAPVDVAALYLGRTRMFPGGEFALVFDQPRDSTVRERFFRQVAGMSLGQVNTYWSRLMFSGQETPPIVMPNEQAVMDVVRRNPGAIGYLSMPPRDQGLRVVLHLKE